jgi:hypothetical protein
MIHLAQVGLTETKQIKAARKFNSSSTHQTQWEVQSTQKTSPMGRVALPFRVASSEFKQGGIIQRLWRWAVWLQPVGVAPASRCHAWVAPMQQLHQRMSSLVVVRPDEVHNSTTPLQMFARIERTMQQSVLALRCHASMNNNNSNS